MHNPEGGSVPFKTHYINAQGPLSSALPFLRNTALCFMFYWLTQWQSTERRRDGEFGEGRIRRGLIGEGKIGKGFCEGIILCLGLTFKGSAKLRWAGARSVLFCLFIEHTKTGARSARARTCKGRNINTDQSESNNNMCCACRTYFLLIALPNDLLLIVLIKKA